MNKCLISVNFCFQSSELEAWTDNTSAWEGEVGDDLTWEAEAAIKEKRRLERERRQMEQQKKKMEREVQKNMRKGQFQAVRLSSS